MNLSIPWQIINKTCTCDKSLTFSSIIFQLIILSGVILAVLLLPKFKKNLLRHFLIITIGVGIFELFTAPMWNNSHLGPWAYIYQDVSWVLNIGWSTLILSAIVLVDHFFIKFSQKIRFLIYLLFLIPIIFLFESFVVSIDIRSYAPEVLNTIAGIKLFSIPIEALYYIPVFIGLIIGFYKYWSFKIENLPVVPVKRTPLLRNLFLSFLAVFMFELMIEPMVTNANFPRWSYIYRDITILLTGFWVLIIWVTTFVVDKFFIYFSLTKKFILYLIFSSIFTFPLESYLINYGYRVYGPSATANFSGFSTILTHIPIEVAFAIPLYLALIISFTRFWEITLDNKL